MRSSKYIYNKTFSDFRYVHIIPGCCSRLTLSGVNNTIRNLSKDEIIFDITSKITKQWNDIGICKEQNKPFDQTLEISRYTTFKSIKVIEISLNKSRFWSWFTPWKYCYGYKGNAGWVSVFKLNVK